MTERKLMDYLDKLKPAEQHYIVSCVLRSNLSRRGFHRGLLPFLTVTEAANALQYQLECENLALISEGVIPHTRYIKGLISKIGGYDKKFVNKTYEVTLDDRRMEQSMRYGAATYFSRHAVLIILPSSIGPSEDNSMVEFLHMKRNRWRITADERLIYEVIHNLVKMFKVKERRK